MLVFMNDMKSMQDAYLIVDGKIAVSVRPLVDKSWSMCPATLGEEADTFGVYIHDDRGTPEHIGDVPDPEHAIAMLPYIALRWVLLHVPARGYTWDGIVEAIKQAPTVAAPTV